MPPSKEQPLTKLALKGFGWSYLSTIIQFAIQAANFTTLAHLLGPREFGIVGMSTIFTNLIERVGFFGIGQAIVQRDNLTPAHVRCGFFLCLVFGLFFFAIFYITSSWIAIFFDEPLLAPVLQVVSLSFVIACVAEVPLNLLQRELKFKELLIVNNTSFLLGNALVGITLAYLGFGYWALVAAIVVGRMVRLLLAFRFRPQRLSLDFTFKEVKDLLSIGVGFSLGRMTNYCALVGDNFVTGKMLGAPALGLYTRAYQLMTGPATYFGQVLEKVFFSALAQRQNEPEKVAKYFLYGIELCSLVSVGGAVILFIAAQEIVLVLFGAHWLEAVPTIRILAFGVFFRTCYKNSDTVVRALGAVYRLAARQAIYAIVVICGAFYFSRWGIEGVAAVVLFSVALNYTLMSYLCIQLLELSWKSLWRAHLPAIWAGLWQFMALSLTFSLCRAAHWPSLLTLICGVLVEGVVTLLALWFCPKWFEPKVFRWIGRNIKFERFGLVGRISKQFLLRGATAI